MYGVWYNLNSTNTMAPQIISDFYLNLFLDSIQENGYLIFAIIGKFPEYNPNDFTGVLRPNQRFITADFISKKHEEDIKTGKYKLNVGSGEQDEIDRVCAESLRIFQESERKKLEEEKQKKFGINVLEQIKLFQGKSTNIQETKIKKCILNRL